MISFLALPWAARRAAYSLVRVSVASRATCDVRRGGLIIGRLTKTALARDFGVSRATVYAYLRGEAETVLEQVLSTLPADERPLASLEDYDALLPFRAAEPVPAERI